MHQNGKSRLRNIVVAAAVVAAALSFVETPPHAQSERYAVAPDAPGSVWRLNVQTGELEHCSLVKGGCDVVDRNE